jgi:prepilin-type N-terminal cleavage/methylation domain-containing protein
VGTKRKMMSRARRPRPSIRDANGVTLIELLVVLVVGGIISGVIFQVVGGQIRISDRLSAREVVQQNARASLELITSEMRGVARGGVVAAAPTSLEVRVPRVWGSVCHVTSNATYATFPPIAGSFDYFTATRAAIGSEFAAGAEVTRYDGDIDALKGSEDDESPCLARNGVQPLIGRIVSGPANPAVGDPVYLYRRVLYEVRDREGRSWIYRGTRSDGGTVAWEAFAGPVRSDGGLVFEYLPGSTPHEDIRQVRVTVRSVERGEQREASSLVFLRATD